MTSSNLPRLYVAGARFWPCTSRRLLFSTAEIMGLTAQRARCSGTGKPAQAVAAYARQSDSLMVIHHGNAQETQLQATELRSRLTSLAVDSARILLLADLPANDRLSIEIRTTK